jgi:hypothetical protein
MCEPETKVVEPLIGVEKYIRLKVLDRSNPHATMVTYPLEEMMKIFYNGFTITVHVRETFLDAWVSGPDTHFSIRGIEQEKPAEHCWAEIWNKVITKALEHSVQLAIIQASNLRETGKVYVN